MSDRNSLQWAFSFVAIAFVFSVGIGLLITGASLLDQLEIFSWTHDIKSFSAEIQQQFDYETTKGYIMQYSGIAVMGFGSIMVYLVYRQIR